MPHSDPDYLPWAFTDSAAGLVRRIMKRYSMPATFDATDTSISSVFEMILTAFAMGYCKELANSVFVSTAVASRRSSKYKIVFAEYHFPAGITRIVCKENIDIDGGAADASTLVLIMPSTGPRFTGGAISEEKYQELRNSIKDWRVHSHDGISLKAYIEMSTSAHAALSASVTSHHEDPTDLRAGVTAFGGAGAVAPSAVSVTPPRLTPLRPRVQRLDPVGATHIVEAVVSNPVEYRLRRFPAIRSEEDGPCITPATTHPAFTMTMTSHSGKSDDSSPDNEHDPR